MPAGRLSLVTVSRRDQRRMRKIAISSQLLCHFIRDKASVGHTCRAHFSISLTLREAFGPTSQDLSYRSPLSARARRRSPAAARISPQCSLAPSTNTDFTIPDHRRPTDRPIDLDSNSLAADVAYSSDQSRTATAFLFPDSFVDSFVPGFRTPSLFSFPIFTPSPLCNSHFESICWEGRGPRASRSRRPRATSE